MQIAASNDDATRQVQHHDIDSTFESDSTVRLSLARSDHTLSVVASKAYLFGGETASGKLASNDMHAVGLEPTEKLQPEYSVVPAVAKEESGKVPIARTKHAACAFNACVAIYGGVNETGEMIDEQSTVWLYHVSTPTYGEIRPESPCNGLFLEYTKILSHRV